MHGTSHYVLKATSCAREDYMPNSHVGWYGRASAHAMPRAPLSIAAKSTSTIWSGSTCVPHTPVSALAGR